MGLRCFLVCRFLESLVPSRLELPCWYRCRSVWLSECTRSRVLWR